MQTIGDARTRDDLPQLFKSMGYKVGAEIGVWRGQFTKKFCQAGIKMYAVDPWISFNGQGRSQRVEENQEYNYKVATEELAPFDCTIIRSLSMVALQYIKSRSLDFVYIDGDHDLPHAVEDIWHWAGKVRSGGVVAGHDYFNTAPWANNVIIHVKAAVDAYVEAFGIKNLCIIDAESRAPSWLWIKE